MRKIDISSEYEILIPYNSETHGEIEIRDYSYEHGYIVCISFTHLRYDVDYLYLHLLDRILPGWDTK